MKWFGVDYRYVIAGVGAVFILAYEFVGPNPEKFSRINRKLKTQKHLA